MVESAETIQDNWKNLDYRQYRAADINRKNGRDKSAGATRPAGHRQHFNPETHTKRM